ncbi:MAG: polysaccharide deacetylase family protein [Bacilli bacterium]|nr:polysaccharide deacetylase family protein [Bacilli bacterium]
MKKFFQVIFVLALSCFSFYYTEKAIYWVSLQDPIMKEIKKNKKDYEKESLNAQISDNEIVPGVSGKQVDEIKSFKKMKQYGEYNDSLYVFNEDKPKVSIKGNYDRYVTSASSTKKSVALIFTIDRSTNPEDILNILKEEDVLATFFIDGLWIENNVSITKKIIDRGHEVEVLSYNGTYDDVYFPNSLSILNSLTGKKVKYCYSSYKNKDLLSLCSKLSLYTIVPTIEVNSDSYIMVKSKISNGSLISLTNSSKQLSMSIKYIKQKGYKLETVADILTE